jgi:outer membrane autotransporter protein
MKISLLSKVMFAAALLTASHNLMCYGQINSVLSPRITQSESNQEIENEKENDPNQDTVKSDKFVVGQVVDRLGHPNAASAGADSKTLTTSSQKLQTSAWFRDPVAYSEVSFTSTDNHGIAGADGQKYTAQVGFDFTTVGDVLVGLLYTYSYSDKELKIFGPFLQRNQNFSHTITAYAGKSFFNFLNVGGTASYKSEGASTYDNLPFSTRTRADIDGYGFSAFAGVSHTFGNWSLASTPTYIYQSEYTDTGFAFAPGTSASSGTLAILNKAEYSFTEKFSLAGLLDWTQIIHENSLPANSDRGWMTLGTRATYSFTKSLDAYLGYEVELFNREYSNQTVRLGGQLRF